jgi:hypothetical protein
MHVRFVTCRRIQPNRHYCQRTISGSHGPATGHIPLGTLCLSIIIIGSADRRTVIISVVLVPTWFRTVRCNVSFLVAIVAGVDAEVTRCLIGCGGTPSFGSVAAGAGR